MKKYKNVLHFADYGSPYKGNFISSLEILEKELLDQKHKMFYLFPKRTSKRDWTKEKENTSFLTGNFIKDLKLVHHLIKYNDIDIIHIHFYTFRTLLLFKLANIHCKIVIHLHGIFSNYSGIKKVAIKFLFKKTNVIGCSEAVTNSFKFTNVVNSITCIKNAIYFPRLDKYDEFINEFDIKNDATKILIFGYNYYIKGVDVALEAISKARENNKKIYCFVSISSNQDVFEKNVVKTFGKFPDWIKILKPRNDIATYYRNCDIFISASRKEGFCYALVEAAYSGCNLIASDIPAQKELKIDDILWFESENIDDLKNKILTCIKFKKENRKKIITQKEQIGKMYDILAWSKSIVDQYENI